jgi:hypothetical protein
LGIPFITGTVSRLEKYLRVGSGCYETVESGADPESGPGPLTENEPNPDELIGLEGRVLDPDSLNPDPDIGFLVNPNLC